jgi:hypothetical protein
MHISHIIPNIYCEIKYILVIYDIIYISQWRTHALYWTPQVGSLFPIKGCISKSFAMGEAACQLYCRGEQQGCQCRASRQITHA